MKILNLYLEAVLQLKKALEDLEVAQKFSASSVKYSSKNASFLLIVQMLRNKKYCPFLLFIILHFWNVT